MQRSQQLAKNFRELYFGGNWTGVNLKEQLSTIDCDMANKKLDGINNILTLVFHIHYYVVVATKVLEGGPLEGNDARSFEHPAVETQEAWEQLLQKIWEDAGRFALLVENVPEDQLWQDFTDSKYGNYYRNLQGIVEHAHYHLGQIVLLKKMLGASHGS